MTSLSILGMFWAKLDELVDLAYEETPASPSLAGEIKGVMSCVAIMTNPYHPDIKAVRKEAVRRFKERHGPAD